MRIAAETAERAVEGQRRARLLDRRLLHEVARRPEQVRHREARRSRGQDRRPREHPRHVRDDVRQPEARAARRSSRPAAATRTAASAAIRRSRRRSSARSFLQIKIDNALAQIKGLMAGTMPPSDGAGRRVAAGRGGPAGQAADAAQNAAAARPARGTDACVTAPAGTPSSAPDTRVHRRADLGRNARRDEGRQDDRRSSRPAAPRRTGTTWCSANTTTSSRYAANHDGAPAQERARRADDSVRARGRSGYVGAGRDLAARRRPTTCCSMRPRAA